MTLDTLNTLPAEQAYDWFMQTCTSTRWCERMVANRPFADRNELTQAASTHWQASSKDDFLEAFAGHPMIGDINSLRAKYANTQSLAKSEQSGVETASDEVLNSLRELNLEYLHKHGFIFIICATGLSAQAMRDAIAVRVNQTTEQELATAAQEQLKITLLRIDKALDLKEITS